MVDLILPLTIVLIAAELVALVALAILGTAGAIDGVVHAAVVLLAVVTTVIAPIGVTTWSRGIQVPSLRATVPALAPVRIPSLEQD